MQALRDELIIEKIFEDKVGSIFIPEAKKSREYHSGYHGVVRSIGPDYPYTEDVKVGSKVFFRRHEGKKILVEGKEYYAIRERFVEGVFN